MAEEQHIKSLLKILNQNKLTLLKNILKDFKLDNLKPIIGIELEFYLQEQNSIPHPQSIKNFIEKAEMEIRRKSIEIYKIEQEQGAGQIEIKTAPYQDLILLCRDIVKIKSSSREIAKTLGLKANFASQLYQNDCGSSMQINFSIFDKQNKNLLSKNQKSESHYFLGVINKLLCLSKQNILIFAPKDKDYARFNLNLNKNLHNNRKYTAPVNISWGYENRTTLIRIPKVENQQYRRLEFRLPSSSCDVYLAIIFFLLIILDNTENYDKQDLDQPIYGNAFDEQYQLERLPQNYKTACKIFVEDSKALQKILKNC